MSTRYARSRQYVGVDLHRRRSVVVRMNGAGAVLDCVQVDNSVPALVGEVAKAGPGVEVAVEATYGWYWAVDALSDAGFEVRLAHPRGVASMQGRRAKNRPVGCGRVGGSVADRPVGAGVDRAEAGAGVA